MPVAPTHTIRLQAIVLAPEGQKDPLKNANGEPCGAAQIQQEIDYVNSIYAQAGIKIVFDPKKDIEGESSSLSLDNSDASARENRAASYQGKAVVYFRDGSGGYSGEGSFAVVMKPGNGPHLAHELGHFFGLSHVHAAGVTLDGVAQLVSDKLSDKVKSNGFTTAIQKEAEQIINAALDGDAPGTYGVPHPVTDTLPSIHEWSKDMSLRCTANLEINVTFKSGLKHTFTYTPDRTNIMSYFQGCPQCDHLTTQQIAVMRSLIQNGIRHHLLGPSLRWSGWSPVSGGGITDAPVAATNSGALNVLLKDTGGSILRNKGMLKGNALEWGTWSELEGKGKTNLPPAITAFDNKLYAFVTGPTGLIFHNYASAGQSFQSQWFEVPGKGIAGSAPATTVFDNKLYAFVTGPTGLIFLNYASAGQPFQQSWFEVAGQGAAKGAPALAAFDNKLYAFVAGPTGHIFHNYASAGQSFLSQWYELPGDKTFLTAPAAVALGDYLHVFAVGTDKKVYMSWARAGQAFSIWQEVPGSGITDAAPAVTVYNGQLYLLVKGMDQRIYANSATPN
jgi:hypothetical protein